MSAYSKVEQIIKGHIPQGHADRNRTNIESLRKANEEIKRIIKDKQCYQK
jgi:hypothetical protein